MVTGKRSLGLPSTVSWLRICGRALAACVVAAGLLYSPVNVTLAEGQRISDEEYAEIEKAQKSNIRSKEAAGAIRGIEALAKTNHPKAADAIYEIFSKRKDVSADDIRVKTAAAEALGKFTDPEALDVIAAEAKKLADIKDSTQLYYAYLIMRGMARGESQKARDFVADAVNSIVTKKPKQYWSALAGLEAIADSRRSSFLPLLYNVLLQDHEAFKTDYQIVPLAALNGVRRLTSRKNKDQIVASLSCIADILDRYTTVDVDRVRYLAARAAYDFCQFDKTLKLTEPQESPTFLRWYQTLLVEGSVKPGEDATKANRKEDTGQTREDRPKLSGMQLPGRRIVFCIDISTSMLEEITPEDREKITKDEGETTGGNRKKEGEGDEDEKEEKKREMPPLNWDEIKTKLDLAKAELKRTLTFMQGQNFLINIVTYSTESGLIDEERTGMVATTEGNVADFHTLINNLECTAKTNIHGALMDGLRITKSSTLDEEADVGLDREALLHGADSIFFLTDGWSNFDDFSDLNEQQEDPRWPGTTHKIGKGPYCLGPDILVHFTRLNKFRKVIVNTIGIGNHDRELMASLAWTSGGQYKNYSNGRTPNRSRDEGPIDDNPIDEKSKGDSPIDDDAEKKKQGQAAGKKNDEEAKG